MSGHLFAGDDGDHARKLLRSRRVDSLDPCVSMDAAHNNHVQHAGQHDVIDVCRGSRHETGIFLSLHSQTDVTLRHT